jgi:FeS assembly SUF system protein
MDHEAERPSDARGTAPENPADDAGRLHERIIAALKRCYDPEIPVDIYELGLIYGVELDDTGNALVRMTLTSPACPVAGSLPGEVELKVREVDGVRSARVELVWDPPWDKDMMSEAAKLELGFM